MDHTWPSRALFHSWATHGSKPFLLHFSLQMLNEFKQFRNDRLTNQVIAFALRPSSNRGSIQHVNGTCCGLI